MFRLGSHHQPYISFMGGCADVRYLIECPTFHPKICIAENLMQIKTRSDLSFQVICILLLFLARTETWNGRQRNSRDEYISTGKIGRVENISIPENWRFIFSYLLIVDFEC